ncbi:MAG: RNA methyltransferase [Chitinophagaceae bacterium]|nr:MAG: RNA methyltransferase [Chitinophagaceae bacterium]
MLPERRDRIQEVAFKRQPDLTVVMENIADPHNVYAIMRSCDAVGVPEVYVIDEIDAFRRKPLGKRSSSSAAKWVNPILFSDAESCFQAVKKKYEHILATHISDKSDSLYTLDLTKSVALVFGNERYGISPQALKHCNGHFWIPMSGMVDSLNVSVACAVSLYEAKRQRLQKGFYEEGSAETQNVRKEIFSNWITRETDRKRD